MDCCALAQPRGALRSRVDRLLEILAGDHLARCPAGLKVCLRHEVAKMVDGKRELAGVIGQAGRVLGNQRDAISLDRPEPLALHDRGDQTRVNGLAGRRAVDVVLEIGEYLEEFGELRIERR
jgi:hypothetical protein